jgi:competence ComEA-like helix-hairpin-helix protein
MLSLTPDERKVIIFLTTILLIGAGINFLNKRFTQAKTILSIEQDFARINLNTADKELLMSVPGIGGKLAARIIEYRQKEMCFKDIQELKKIKGITEYRYEKIKDYLTVR